MESAEKISALSDRIQFNGGDGAAYCRFAEAPFRRDENPHRKAVRSDASDNPSDKIKATTPRPQACAWGFGNLTKPHGPIRGFFRNSPSIYTIVSGLRFVPFSLYRILYAGAAGGAEHIGRNGFNRHKKTDAVGRRVKVVSRLSRKLPPALLRSPKKHCCRIPRNSRNRRSRRRCNSCGSRRRPARLRNSGPHDRATPSRP